MGSKIRVGDMAPDFSALSNRGELVTLAHAREAASIVLYFYPWDHAPTCVEQAQGFRDAHPQFTAAGATVIGISGDSLARHCSFAAKHTLPYLLLSDESGEVRRAYGIPRKFGILPGRVTYVIDRAGFVRDVFIAQFQAMQHVERALREVQKLSLAVATNEGGKKVAA